MPQRLQHAWHFFLLRDAKLPTRKVVGILRLRITSAALRHQRELPIPRRDEATTLRRWNLVKNGWKMVKNGWNLVKNGWKSVKDEWKSVKAGWKLERDQWKLERDRRVLPTWAKRDAGGSVQVAGRSTMATPIARFVKLD